jgi:hypothetical protein
MFFRGRKFANAGTLRPAKSRVRGRAEFGKLGSAKMWSHEHAEARNLNCWRPGCRRSSDSGVQWRLRSGLRRWGTRESAERWRPFRESAKDLIREFWAKTSTNYGRSKVKVVVPKSPGLECELVADLWICKGWKDVLVCVHIRNILRAPRVISECKSPFISL